MSFAAKNKIRLKGSWQEGCSGGCLNYASWRFNPQLFLSCSEDATVTVNLKQHQSEQFFHIGIYVAPTDGSGNRVLIIDQEKLVAKAAFSKSASVTVEFAIEKDAVVALIPCTFKPQQHCQYTLMMESTAGKLTATPISPKKEYRMASQKQEWAGPSAGGCKNNPTVVNNPQFSLRTEKSGNVVVTLGQTDKEPFDTIGFYVCKAPVAAKKPGAGKSISDLPGLSPVVKRKSSAAAVTRISKLSSKNIVAKCEFASDKEASLEFRASSKLTYIIIPCTFEPGREAKFTLTTFSRSRAKFKSLNKSAKEIILSGTWHDDSAGGSLAHPTWRNNPQYFLYIKRNCSVTITLTQNKTFDLHAIGVYLVKPAGGSQITRLLNFPSEALVAQSEHLKGAAVSVTVTLERRAEPYVIIPTTKEPEKMSKFQINEVIGSIPGSAIVATTVASLLPCTFLWHQRTIKGHWGSSSSGGSRGTAGSQWLSNPQISIKVAGKSKAFIILHLASGETDNIGLYLLKDSRSLDHSLKIKDDAAASQVEQEAVFVGGAEAVLECTLEKGRYIVIPSTRDAGVNKAWKLTIYCDSEQFTASECHANTSEHNSKLAKAGQQQSSSGEWVIDMSKVTIFHDSILGQGGYGCVYKGEMDGQEVAVKKMLTELMQEEDLTVFRKEIQIMHQYVHENIVRFMGANLVPPDICIVSELCAKGSLAKVLKLEKDLAWGKKIGIAQDTARGMAFLHGQKPAVVHRDLKSLNILIDSAYTGKLCDFGLSKTTSGSSLNSVCGSLNWCAPEVLLRNAAFTRHADTYSFGMVLYELYTHKAPFSGMGPMQIVAKIQKGTSLPIPSECPRAYSLVIRGCWNDEPKQRPPFKAILKKLEEITEASFTQ